MGTTMTNKKTAAPAGLTRRARTIQTLLEPIEEVHESPTPKNKEYTALKRTLSGGNQFELTKDVTKNYSKFRIRKNSKPTVVLITKEAGEIVKAAKLNTKYMQKEEPPSIAKVNPKPITEYITRHVEVSPSHFDSSSPDSKSTTAVSGFIRESDKRALAKKEVHEKTPKPEVCFKNKQIQPTIQTYGQLARPTRCKQVIIARIPSNHPSGTPKDNPNIRIRVLPKKNEDDIKPLTRYEKYRDDDEIRSKPKFAIGTDCRPVKSIRMISTGYLATRNIQN